MPGEYRGDDYSWNAIGFFGIAFIVLVATRVLNSFRRSSNRQLPEPRVFQGLQVCKWYLLWGLKSINRTYFGLCGAPGYS